LPFNDRNQFQTKPFGFDPNTVYNANTYLTANKGDLPLLNQSAQQSVQ